MVKDSHPSPDRSTVNRRTYLKASGLAVGGVALAGCSDLAGGGDDETIEIADFLPETHHIREHNLLPWVDRVEELMDGDVEFELYFGEEMGSENEMLSLARDQVVDISIVSPAYNPAELQLAQVATLPATFDDPEVGNAAYWDVTEEILYEEELTDLDLRPVLSTVEAPYQVYHEGPQIIELDDWSGRNVRSAGGYMSVAIDALGGTPNDISSVDQFSAHERGVVDANLQAEPSFESWDIYQFMEYGTTNVNTSSWSAHWVTHEDNFDSYSDELQDAMLTAAEEMAPATGAAYRDEEVEPLREYFRDQGIELYEVPDQQLQDWNDALADVQDEWIEEVEDNDLPGQQTFDRFEELISQYN